MSAVVTVWQDIACPWATLALFRFRKTRARLGLDDRVAIDLKAFPLELVNSRPTPKATLDAEIPVAGGLEPSFGWRLWRRPASEWPVTTLPSLEAVYAAKHQSLRAGEELDVALRRALFCESVTISMHHDIVKVADTVPGVDTGSLREALETGRYRERIFADHRIASSTDVKGSPHFFLPDGTDEHNPGIELHWTQDGRGIPVVDKDDPGIYDSLLMRAAEIDAKGES